MWTQNTSFVSSENLQFRSESKDSRKMYLFESHEDLLPLAEVSEEKVQGSRHQRRVIMHGQMQQDPQEGPASVVVQI